MDTDSVIVYIKTDNIYKGIAEEVETRFDTVHSYELERALPKGNKSNSTDERWISWKNNDRIYWI